MQTAYLACGVSLLQARGPRAVIVGDLLVPSVTRRQTHCPNCGRKLQYARYHAGFSNEGFMYCDRDETVLTWDAYSPNYRRITSQLPWELDVSEQRRVEAAVKPCPYGGGFSFENPPLCPHCHESLAVLVSGRDYFIVTMRRIDADSENMWVAGST